MKAVNTICLCLTIKVKYNVLNETSTFRIMEKKFNFYILKFLINKLFIKKQFYQLQMDEGTNILDHLNVFNKIITQLLSLEVNIEEEEKALLLLASLSSSFGTLVITLLVGKTLLGLMR